MVRALDERDMVKSRKKSPELLAAFGYAVGKSVIDRPAWPVDVAESVENADTAGYKTASNRERRFLQNNISEDSKVRTWFSSAASLSAFPSSRVTQRVCERMTCRSSGKFR